MAAKPTFKPADPDIPLVSTDERKKAELIKTQEELKGSLERLEGVHQAHLVVKILNKKNNLKIKTT